MTTRMPSLVCVTWCVALALAPPSQAQGPISERIGRNEEFERTFAGDTSADGAAYILAGSACRARTVTALVEVRGRIDGRRASGRFWFATDRQVVRLESTGRPPLVALYRRPTNQSDQEGAPATLFSPAHGVVASDASRNVVAALIGVPLQMDELLWVLDGCATHSGGLESQTFGPNTVRITVGDDRPLTVVLSRPRVGPSWSARSMVRPVAGTDFRWMAEPGRRVGWIQREARLWSVEWNGERGRRFDLRFRMSRVQADPALSPEVFAPDGLDAAREAPLAAVLGDRVLPVIRAGR